MIRFLLFLFSKATNSLLFICAKRGHRWKDISFNSYSIPTVQECKSCHVTRKIESKPAMFGSMRTSNFFWIYSDGTEVPDERVLKHVGVTIED